MMEVMTQVLAIFAAAAGAYAAIKADLTKAIMTAEMGLKQAGEAHQRISDHVERHHVKEG